MCDRFSQHNNHDTRRSVFDAVTRNNRYFPSWFSTSVRRTTSYEYDAGKIYKQGRLSSGLDDSESFFFFFWFVVYIRRRHRRRQQEERQTQAVTSVFAFLCVVSGAHCTQYLTTYILWLKTGYNFTTNTILILFP